MGRVILWTSRLWLDNITRTSDILNCTIINSCQICLIDNTVKRRISMAPRKSDPNRLSPDQCQPAMPDLRCPPLPRRRPAYTSQIPFIRRLQGQLSRASNSAIPPASILHIVGIHARRRRLGVDACARLVAALVVYVFDVEGVNVAGEVSTSTRQQLFLVRVLVGSERSSWRVRRRNWGAGEERGRAYPRMVSKMLMRRSGPQPATRKTPMGGTGGGG